MSQLFTFVNNNYKDWWLFDFRGQIYSRSLTCAPWPHPRSGEGQLKWKRHWGWRWWWWWWSWSQLCYRYTETHHNHSPHLSVAYIQIYHTGYVSKMCEKRLSSNEHWPIICKETVTGLPLVSCMFVCTTHTHMSRDRNGIVELQRKTESQICFGKQI